MFIKHWYRWKNHNDDFHPTGGVLEEKRIQGVTLEFPVTPLSKKRMRMYTFWKGAFVQDFYPFAFKPAILREAREFAPTPGNAKGLKRLSGLPGSK
jgi:hypothetical protein